MKTKVLFGILVAIIFSSCTIQKRVHRPGWHVEWHKKYKGEESTTYTSKVKVKQDAIVEENEHIISEEPSLSKEKYFAETEFVEEVNFTNTPFQKKFGHDDEIILSTFTSETTSSANESTLKSEVKSEKRSKNGLWLVFLIFGALLFLLGIVLLSITTSEAALFGVLLVLFGLVIGIISVVIHVAMKDAKKNKQEGPKLNDPKIEEEKPEKTPEEKAKNNRNALIAFGSVLLGILIMILTF